MSRWHALEFTLFVDIVVVDNKRANEKTEKRKNPAFIIYNFIPLTTAEI